MYVTAFGAISEAKIKGVGGNIAKKQVKYAKQLRSSSSIINLYKIDNNKETMIFYFKNN